MDCCAGRIVSEKDLVLLIPGVGLFAVIVSGYVFGDAVSATVRVKPEAQGDAETEAGENEAETPAGIPAMLKSTPELNPESAVRFTE